MSTLAIVLLGIVALPMLLMGLVLSTVFWFIFAVTIVAACNGDFAAEIKARTKEAEK